MDFDSESIQAAAECLEEHFSLMRNLTYPKYLVSTPFGIRAEIKSWQRFEYMRKLEESIRMGVEPYLLPGLKIVAEG